MGNLSAPWSENWASSLPLIIMTVLLHALGLILMHEMLFGERSPVKGSRPFALASATVLAATVLLVTALHAIEGGIWAVAYVELGALPDFRSAMLYSLSAMTTFGHADLYLERQWQMMGALEALNGMMLFGLTTAFLFSVLHELWSKGARLRP